MDKEKRKLCFILTISGVILIIVLQTIISIDNEAREKEENYIKVNVVKAFKECVNDEVCEEEDTTFSILIDSEYLSGYFLKEIEDYSTSSYVDASSYEVYLIKKED